MRWTANDRDAARDRVSRVGTACVRTRHTRRFRRAAGGMRYYGYRHLSTDLGRWVTRDTLGEWAYPNLRVFADVAAEMKPG
jgi:hypothetical protein